ncbi:MAG TPA: hypothetical protein VF278_19220 [Pirellulales bacterium]
MAAEALVFQPGELELGRIPLGESRAFEATVRNSSHEVVRIEGIVPGCSCTDVRCSDWVLAPGASATVAGELRKKTHARPFRHPIFFSIRDGGSAALFVSGDAAAHITATPASPSLHPNFVASRAGTATITIENTSEVGIDLLPPAQLPNGVEASLSEAHLPPGGHCVATVRALPHVLVASDTVLSFPCTHPAQTSIEISLGIRPAHKVSVAPEVLAFGVISPEALRRASPVAVTLEGAILADCVLSGHKAPPYLSLTRSVPGGEILRLEFSVDGEKTISDLAGEIKLDFKHEPSRGAFSIRIPTCGFIDSRGP